MDKKVQRILNLYERLLDGDLLRKREEAIRFGVNERTIQRDLDDIRSYYANGMDVNRQIVYDRRKRGYVLQWKAEKRLTRKDIFLVCKVLLGNWALAGSEVLPIIHKLIQCCEAEEDRRKLSTFLANESFHYKESDGGQLYKTIVWDIAEAAYEQKLVQIQYQKDKIEESVELVVQPVGIIYSEGHFYLTVYISGEMGCVASKTVPEVVVTSEGENPTYPVVYRLDKIVNYRIMQEHFHVPYSERFEEGVFQKMFHPGDG